MNHLEQAAGAAQASVNQAPSPAPQTAAAPAQTSQDLAPSVGQAPSVPQVLELDKHEKFKWNGEEWSVKDLQNAVLRQSDYTRKTQEIAKERDFIENLPYDLAHIKKDPSLVAKFKEVYPEKYHSLVAEYENQQQAQGQVTQQTQPDQQFLSRLERIESQLMEKEVQAIESGLDSTFTKMKEKYPLADEESVLARASNLIDSKTFADLDKQGRITDAGWDKIFKSINDRNQKMAESHYKQLVEKQTKASAKAKDGGIGGGGAPGQAPKAMNLKEATEYMLKQVEGQKF